MHCTIPGVGTPNPRNTHSPGNMAPASKGLDFQDEDLFLENST